MSFSDWYRKADSIIGAKCGLSADDLPECLWADWHEDGMSPREAAAEALDNAGYEA